MALFEYQALTAAGRLMNGKLEAGDLEEARASLAQMQLQAHSISKAPPSRPRGRIGRHEFALFNQQLASIATAGIPLERGLREVARDVDSRKMRALIAELAGDLESGMPMPEAFQKRKGQFPPLYGRIIEAGVQSGRLGDMLLSLNRHVEMTAQTRRIVIEAVTYPLIVLALAAAVMTAILVWLVPQLTACYTDSSIGLRLPMTTQALVWVSHHVGPIWIVIGSAVACAVVAGVTMRRSPSGRRGLEWLYLHIPVAGRLYRHGLMARLADSLALLIAAGCDMPTSLRLAGDATGGERLGADCRNLAEAVERGDALVEAVPFCQLFPPMLAYSMQLGAQRNELEDNLYGLAEMYSQQAQTQQARLKSLLTPVLLVLLGGLMALMITALLLPMVSMLDAMSV